MIPWNIIFISMVCSWPIDASVYTKYQCLHKRPQKVLDIGIWDLSLFITGEIGKKDTMKLLIITSYQVQLIYASMIFI